MRPVHVWVVVVGWARGAAPCCDAPQETVPDERGVPDDARRGGSGAAMALLSPLTIAATMDNTEEVDMACWSFFTRNQYSNLLFTRAKS